MAPELVVQVVVLLLVKAQVTLVRAASPETVLDSVQRRRTETLWVMEVQRFKLMLAAVAVVTAVVMRRVKALSNGALGPVVIRAVVVARVGRTQPHGS
jgi:hypothetical protein